MRVLDLKTSHKPIKTYYEALKQFEKLGVSHEGAVKTAFQSLLETCGQKFHWTLVAEKKIQISQTKKNIFVDGALIDDFNLIYGYWEAKDSQDDLEKEIRKKFEANYPKDNIIFQEPKRAILYQQGRRVADEDITKPEKLVEIVKRFFEYTPPAYAEWDQAVNEFKERIPQLAKGLIDLVEKERKTNKKFINAFANFMDLCKESINPNLSEQAVEEMLIQHLLTERIFRKIFNNPDFVHRNVIAVEIEKVITSLTSQSFSREEFLKKLDPFYLAIEAAAATITDFSQKQYFLNAIYEKFFQGFSVKIADTHGIVYTPQPIVNFMIKSVEEILQKEFGKSLSSPNVHVLDPFVGTGNFIVNIMRQIKKTALAHKYESELHCNEVMLLPYYIASMNIEHEFFELTNSYKPFEGICLVDTFELAENKQGSFAFMNAENTQRIKKQKASPIFVIIGNPPYNVGQVNENDNNKNRKYKIVDNWVSATYTKSSKATNKNALSDPYVKAIRWASDRINDGGILAFVTNNSFVDDIAFDGMRKHLAEDFDEIYILDLGGNVRKNPKLSGTTHNVFGIQLGVSINIFVKKRKHNVGETKPLANIFYANLDTNWRKEQKYEYLEKFKQRSNVFWRLIKPNSDNTWLTEGLQNYFQELFPIANKEAKESFHADSKIIFKNYSQGVQTGRDAWAYNFQQKSLIENIKLTINTYNENIYRWLIEGKQKIKIDNFVLYDDKKIKWSSRLKECLINNVKAQFDENNIRLSLYRPFARQYLYFDQILTHRRGQFPVILPTQQSEKENRIIWLKVGAEWPVFVLAVNCIADLLPQGGSQCFPFYTYNEDGTNQRENITDWALEQFRTHYKDSTITKWDIFYYVYGVLHHKGYREKYAANLKRELPRIPFAPDFKAFAKAGETLADLHINYEQQVEYPLEKIENPKEALDWRVEKMRLSKDKTSIIYNNFLTLANIPEEVFEYRLGNRSALDWIIDQYQVTTDKRSGIVNDPNREDDSEYIVRLIGQIVTVSLETVKIVNSLPEVEI
ncbi:MAG: type ISP restriction/modification enzyme [Blastocatellia bacterium]